MKRLIDWYGYVNLLSIDVALGAVVSAYFLSDIFHLETGKVELMSLGLSVWLIYTFDHLIDAKSISKQASGIRHRFHQRYFYVVGAFCLLAAVTLLILLFYIDESVLILGIGLVIFVLLYFLVQKRLGAVKELCGAILYTAGVTIPLMVSVSSPKSIISIPVFIFFNTALINLILFAWFDKENDAQDGQPSIATIIGRSKTKYILIFLFGIQFVILLFMIKKDFDPQVVTTLAAMSIILFTIFGLKNWFAEFEWYRLLGDAVFLIPILYFF